jgi:hypothetical protein
MRQFARIMCSATLAGILALPTTALAQQKTAKQCNAEWTANKAAIQASGKTKKEYVADCRATAASAPEPAATPAPGKTAPPAVAAAPAKPAPATPAAPPAAGKPTGNAQFSTEAAAKGHCPGDTVVWINSGTNVYHYSGSKNYGTTKQGAYMCEKDTAGAGARAAKNEKHP